MYFFLHDGEASEATTLPRQEYELGRLNRNLRDRLSLALLAARKHVELFDALKRNRVINEQLACVEANEDVAVVVWAKLDCRNLVTVFAAEDADDLRLDLYSHLGGCGSHAALLLCERDDEAGDEWSLRARVAALA